MKNIIAGLHHFILSEDDRKTKEKMLAKYMVESLNTHNYWAFKMLIIEFINLVNVVGQIYFVDAFLGGEFRLVTTHQYFVFGASSFSFAHCGKYTFLIFKKNQGIEIVAQKCLRKYLFVSTFNKYFFF